MTLASSILSHYLIFGRQLYSPSGGTRVRCRMRKITILPSPSSSLSYACCDLFPISEIDRDLGAPAQRTPEHVKECSKWRSHQASICCRIICYDPYLPANLFPGWERWYRNRLPRPSLAQAARCGEGYHSVCWNSLVFCITFIWEIKNLSPILSGTYNPILSTCNYYLLFFK